MKIAWATDLHLQFPTINIVNKFFNKINNLEADMLLIAGDIADGNSLEYWLNQLNINVDIPIYFILGNHDFYHSSIFSISELVSKTCRKLDKLTWLSKVDYIPITDTTALVGHDGWYDTRNGDLYGGVRLNDFIYIADIQPFIADMRLLSERCKEIALVSTNHFKQSLKSAFEKFDNVILVTHVPPFMEATYHIDKISDPEFLPWFSSKKTGEALFNIMHKNIDKHLTVLCGHTHSYANVDILSNLKVIVGKAEYYYPNIQEILDVP